MRPQLSNYVKPNRQPTSNIKGTIRSFLYLLPQKFNLNYLGQYFRGQLPPATLQLKMGLVQLETEVLLNALSSWPTHHFSSVGLPLTARMVSNGNGIAIDPHIKLSFPGFTPPDLLLSQEWGGASPLPISSTAWIEKDRLIEAEPQSPFTQA